MVQGVPCVGVVLRTSFTSTVSSIGHCIMTYAFVQPVSTNTPAQRKSHNCESGNVWLRHILVVSPHCAEFHQLVHSTGSLGKAPIFEVTIASKAIEHCEQCQM